MSGAAEVLIEKKKKILQGPNSVPLSETVVVRQWWKICVTEEP